MLFSSLLPFTVTLSHIEC